MGGAQARGMGGERRTGQIGTMDKRDWGEEGTCGKNEIKTEIRSKIKSAETKRITRNWEGQGTRKKKQIKKEMKRQNKISR